MKIDSQGFETKNSLGLKGKLGFAESLNLKIKTLREWKDLFNTLVENLIIKAIINR